MLESKVDTMLKKEAFNHMAKLEEDKEKLLSI
jgi:hypothetical protein